MEHSNVGQGTFKFQKNLQVAQQNCNIFTFSDVSLKVQFDLDF